MSDVVAFAPASPILQYPELQGRIGRPEYTTRCIDVYKVLMGMSAQVRESV